MSNSAQDQGAGYRSLAYASSLATEPEIAALYRSGGYLISRSIDHGLRDLASAYPLLACRDWRTLREDIEELEGPFVSATIVTDPFAPVDERGLARQFEVVRPLHQHYVIDLDIHAADRIGRHHRRKLRSSAPRDYRIEIFSPGSSFVGRWSDLYEGLVARKNITDMRKFSREIFARQIEVPGTSAVSAWLRDELIGADWYFQDGGDVYAHLSAYSDAGYERAISYPLMQAAIEFFRPVAQRLTLGGVPAGEAHAGLAHFKAGWASYTLPTYICGAVLMEEAFQRLNRGVPPTAEGYFPRYRQGEFVNAH
ncbi:hypothetical protein K32_08440 [Kaistia sp. 32K]|uniref:hypothetical protein n=1 Tax=Kaistia sp. 32K TaxID=2795690 RepID=UPI0019168F81|nr:hypothetical protein [Kaistia sp. 32K]BCP52227.1 hypothetical protein K32_08440 [Kaistia sp. 32K]